MEKVSLREACSLSRIKQICFHISLEDLTDVLKELEVVGFEWMNCDKPTQWSPKRLWSGSGYIGLYDRTITQDNEPFGEEVCLAIKVEDNKSKTVNSLVYCNCDGPGEHIKYTSFEYDLCISCKKEKQH